MSILTLWPIFRELLKGLGILKEQEDIEAERLYKIKLLEMEERGALAQVDTYRQWLASTTPPADRVYVWANTIERLMRPGLTILATYDIFFGPGKIIQVLQDLKPLGPIGFIPLIPFVWWFLGPEIIGPAVSALNNAFGAMAATATVLKEKVKNGTPSKPAAPFTSGTGFRGPEPSTPSGP